jgi:hypothetical protein
MCGFRRDELTGVPIMGIEASIGLLFPFLGPLSIWGGAVFEFPKRTHYEYQTVSPGIADRPESAASHAELQRPTRHLFQ